MAVRVSQQMMFTNFLNNMNFSLSSLMDLNEQASSQKKVNRPSDAPVAASQILQYRTQLRSLEQYDRNADIAQGWLRQADSTLTQVSTVLTRVRELAEQAATGTLSKTNRTQVGFEVRQLFNQLITLANTEYEGQHIFAGHKTSQAAFVESLAVTTNDPGTSQIFDIQGASDKTIVVQFLASGAVGADNLSFRYSRDGGDTWTQGMLASNSNILDLGGVRVTMQTGSVVRQVDTTRMDQSVTADGTVNGTWLWVRPTAEYKGDFEDPNNIRVDRFGTSTFEGTAQGFFKQDVMVKVDSVSSGAVISYSYSLDRGLTWSSGNTTPLTAASNATLPIPGGFLQLSNAGAGTLTAGTQFMVRPQRAQIFYEISPGERIAVNNIGKDVFGGVYKETPCATSCTAAFDGDARNMFEVVGKLVGYIETNNQSGIQECLADLAKASEQVLTAAANVGGRENRLETAKSMIANLTLNKSERLSNIEDADVAELMTRLAMQQIVYESVLKSSSTIMRMSLMNYI